MIGFVLAFLILACYLENHAWIITVFEWFLVLKASVDWKLTLQKSLILELIGKSGKGSLIP